MKTVIIDGVEFVPKEQQQKDEVVWKTAREWLQDDNVKHGQELIFNDGVVGVVIFNIDSINEKFVVNSKAVFLEKHSNGNFFGEIAQTYLKLKCRLGEVRK